MTHIATLPSERQALVAHLDARFANGDIERALGGFALMLITLCDDAAGAGSPDASFGKDLLAAIATRLRTTLRDSDFLAQFDERTFAVVIPQISDRATAERITQKLRAAFLQPVGDLDTGAGDVFALKIGFSLFPSDGLTRELLMAHALAAMSLPGKNARS